jgi:N-acetylglucosaminyldiphosphoundecaprenol N-acetyl-beta-D-mannosaminyltransferase
MDSEPRIELFDCAFDSVTTQSAVERCVHWCQMPRASHTVLTANAAILCMKRRDRALDAACRVADLVVPDGASVVWAARLAGSPLPERIAGVDFMVELLAAAGRHGLRVYLLGARREVVEKLADRCERDYPGLVLAGWRDGYFREAEHAAIVEEIRKSQADLLFVGMPSPFKETWCELHRRELDVPVIMGVGGSFDVLAGYIRRAPRALQALGLEWFWRLCMEPRKLWKRYLFTNTEFLWLTLGLVARRRLGLGAAAKVVR